MDAELQHKCSELLDFLFSLKNSEAFRERVNWEEWGLYDYLQVVKVPMDLGTIRHKLSNSEYHKPAEFAKDVRLVWDNCKLYNQDGSELYHTADELAKRFEDRVKSMKLDVGGAPPRPDKRIPAPTTEEKILLSHYMFKLTPQDLGDVVALLEEKSPKALDKSLPDELDIVVDLIDTTTFRDVETLVRERLPATIRDAIVATTATTTKSSRKSASSSLKRSASTNAQTSSSKRSKSTGGAATDAADADVKREASADAAAATPKTE